MTSEERIILTRQLHSILDGSPSQDKYQLREILVELAYSNYSTSDINSVLYGNRRLFYHSDHKLPLWFVHELESTASATSLDNSAGIVDLSFYKGNPPRAWQQEALLAWINAGRRGVVEAVTGTGKTTLGILAAADAAARNLDVLVVVPSIVLLDQWFMILEQCLPDLVIGKFGARYKDSFTHCHVIVSTVHSARNHSILPEGSKGLLIADEVHGYGAEKSSLALEPGFQDRLGFTATYDRNDNGLEELLSPYFSPIGSKGMPGDEVIVGCGYARGLADGILSPFRVALIGVDLEEAEQCDYEYFNNKVKKLKNQLILNHGCPKEPFGEFMAGVSMLSKGNCGNPQGTNNARSYLNYFNKRRNLLAVSTKKSEALRVLAPIIRMANRSLIFTQTIDSAAIIADLLRIEGILAFEYSSDFKTETLTEMMKLFKDGIIKTLVSPKMLDEGIDVPEADLGIIVAASHNKRQMIQRMGRIIRPKKDSRPATFIILYVRNTNEDPAIGIHEAYLSEMYDHAEEIKYLEGDNSVKELIEWF